jgi:16S rRNA (guanine527-N7)-methyltransferase
MSMASSGSSDHASAEHSALLSLLVQNVSSLELSLVDDQLSRLVDYVLLIERWNKTYNLSAVRDPKQMLFKHILDSLTPLPQLFSRLGPGSLRVLDVGSGAGLPGVVWAIAAPQLEVHCVDTVGKKASFIQHVANSLGLSNLKAHHARVESLKLPAFDLVTSRAFASLVDFTQSTLFHVKQDTGLWLALKGVVPTDELSALAATRPLLGPKTDSASAQLALAAKLVAVEPVTVPGLDESRCLVWLKPEICLGQVGG